MKIRIGTRTSNLAMIQTSSIKELLETGGHEVEIVPIHTMGDRILNIPIDAIGSKGVFVREVEEKLLDHTIDLAVHSLKDVPSQLPESLTLALPPKAAPPEDAFIGKESVTQLMDLEHLTIGTGSNRRKNQLKTLFKDKITIVPIRGNIETRMKKLETEGLDGIILARAGLVRGSYQNRIQLVIDPKHMIPSPCQGILGLEYRKEDHLLGELLSTFSDAHTALRMNVERAFQKELGGDCESPIGIYTESTEKGLTLHACYAADKNQPLRFAMIKGSKSEGVLLAQELARRVAHA